MNNANGEQPKTLTIKLFDFRLAECNLDALASEFYGKVLSNFKISNGEIGIEFESTEHMHEFSNALECFRIDFGNK